MSDPRRLALVIGSQCPALGELSFLPREAGPVDVATQPPERRLLVDMRDLLVDGPGECDPVIDGIDGLSDPGLLLNPAAAEASAALREAMSAAHANEAVLVVHVLAHGTGFQADPAAPVRHLLHAWDTAANPTGTGAPSKAWDPYADIVATWPQCARMTGLVLVIDACKTSWASPAIAAWSGVRGGLMSAVLTASGDHAAWDACLTRTLVDVLRTGLPAADHHRGTLVAELLVADIEPLAAKRCVNQTPRVAGYQNHNVVLKLAANPASQAFASALGLDARTAGLMLRLTRDYVDHALGEISEQVEEHRVVSIVGPAGCGKSTLAAALRRAPEDSNAPIGLVHAAAFTSAAAGVSELARSLTSQLRSLPGFNAAAARFARDNQHRWDTLDIWQRELIGPLGLLRQDVRLLIDGLDQLDGTVHEAAVRRAVQRLLEEVPRARIVATSRRDPHLPDAIDVRMPSVSDDAARRFLRARGIDPAAHDRLIDIADGRWLVLDLAADHADKPGAVTLEGLYARLVARARSRSGKLVDDVLALLAAAGTGPVLPVDLLQAALRTTRQTSRAEILKVLGDEDLYRVVDRAGPGTAGDHAGLFHETLTDHLRAGNVVPAHLALAEALEQLAPDHNAQTYRDHPVGSYAFDAHARHWWEAGHLHRVVADLSKREDIVPRVNLDRWQTWSERLQRTVGPANPMTLAARDRVAYWTGRAGDLAGALRLSQDLLADQLRVLGPDHPDTLSNRGCIAPWTGEAGDPDGALQLCVALLADQLRVLGPDHVETLITRHNIAFWTGQSGDPQTSLRMSQDLLPDQLRVLGPDHEETLITRHNIAFATGRTGDAAGALRLFTELLVDRERVLGADHSETLKTRGNISRWTGDAGDPAGALLLSRALLPDRERVLGADHPDTLKTRHSIAHWTEATGNPQRARQHLETLLVDRERVLGTDHPDTIATRASIDRLRAGD